MTPVDVSKIDLTADTLVPGNDVNLGNALIWNRREYGSTDFLQTYTLSGTFFFNHGNRRSYYANISHIKVNHSSINRNTVSKCVYIIKFTHSKEIRVAWLEQNWHT